MRTTSFIRALLVPCILGAAPSVDAQLADIQTGARVRLAAPGLLAARIEGIVERRTTDSIAVVTQPGAIVVVPIRSITAGAISRGKSRTAGAKHGMLWGVPIMTLGGILVAAIDECGSHNAAGRTSSGCVDTGWEIVPLAVVSGVLYGAGIGALIGRERWDQFELPVRVSVRPSARGVALSVRMGNR